MDYINRLLGTADEYVSDPDKPLDTDATVHDLFDEELYTGLLDEVPALAELVDELGWKYPFTRDLVRDVLMLFWQSDPRVRTKEEMDPRFLQNQAVASDINEAPDTPLTRTMTKHDRYGATMATLGVVSSIQEALDRFKEAQEAAKEAEEQRKEQQSAWQKLMEALKELREQMAPFLDPDTGNIMGCMPGGPPPGGEPDPNAPQGETPTQGGIPNGPLTEAQQAAVDNLQQMVVDFDEAKETLDEADGKAEDEAGKFGRAVRADVNEAIRQAGNDLRDEMDLFSAWGFEDGEVKKMSFKERAELARRLRSSKFHKYLDQIGRWKMMIATQSTRRTQYGRDEVVGTELAGELDRVLGSELVKSRHPAMRLDFLSRFNEDKLLSRKFVGVEKVGKGAVIAVWDESGSMRQAHAGGTRELWAKGFTLGLLDYCRSQKRDFVGVAFSSANQQKIYRFPKGEGDINEVLGMVEHFFDGGTDYMVPLDKAVDILEDEFNQMGRAQGDIIFITDDDARVTPEWMHKYNERKTKLDFHTWGVAISSHAGNALRAISDNVREVSEFMDQQSVADIIQQLD